MKLSEMQLSQPPTLCFLFSTIPCKETHLELHSWNKYICNALFDQQMMLEHVFVVYVGGIYKPLRNNVRLCPTSFNVM